MFEIDVLFCNCFGQYEEKHEFSDTWEQAFGAFTIYVSDPDCRHCIVWYDENKKTLEYRAPD